MAVTNDLTLIHACNATTDATTSHVLSGDGGADIKTYADDEVTPKEGTGCYGVDLDVETLYFNIAHASSSWNMTNSTIYAWFKFITSDYLDTWENGGVTCRLLDASSNYSEWYLGGSDSFGGDWERVCFSTSTTPDAVSGTLSISAVTNIRFYFTGAIKSKLAENVLMDFVHYGADGTGITVTGGSSGTPETLSDVEGDDDTANIGILFERNGIYLMNGAITFGDSGGTSDMYFKDTSQVIAMISRYRSFTTANRTSAETLLSSSHFDITIEGNTTGTHSFVLGNASGESGYAGLTIICSGAIEPAITIGNANVDTFEIYGTNLIGLGSLTLVDDASFKIYTVTLDDCKQFVPVGAPIIRNCNFINTSDADAALLWNESIDIEDCKFIANSTGAAIEMPSAVGTPYDYDNLKFSGNTYDVLNSSGSPISISKTNGSDPASSEGSAVTFTSAAVTVQATITDADGDEIEDALVYMQADAKSSGTATTDTANKLVDTNATFETDGVAIGDTAFNKTDGTSALVTAVDSETSLSLGSDAFPDGDEDYRVGGPYPDNDTVTIVNSGTTATVTHTGHGMLNNDYVYITGGSLDANRGVFQITYINANSYSYTMGSTPGSSPTGTITSTFVGLYGLTSASGVTTTNRVYAGDQLLVGWARKSSSSPYYQDAPLRGTVDSSDGLYATGVLVSDE